MNTPLTLTEVMNCLGADLLPSDAPNQSTPCWIAPVVFHEGDGSPLPYSDEAEVGHDIYQLMAVHGKRMASAYDALALYTCGWASPVTDDEHADTPPSQHPKRMRVAMLCLVTKNGDFGSALKMYGNPEQPDMMIENEGRGQLRDSAVAMWDNHE